MARKRNTLSNIYVGDFETENSEWNWEHKETHVWEADLCSLEDYSHHTVLTIDEFMNHLLTLGSCTIYFHNLKFDGQVILDWLFRNNWVCESGRLTKDHTYSFLCSEMGAVYSMQMCYREKGPHNSARSLHIIEFRDSLKKINAKVEKIGEDYKLTRADGSPLRKGECDYTMRRPDGYLPTDEEIDYVQRDTEIVAQALRKLYDEGMTYLTAASDTFHLYKECIGKKNFDEWFPVLSHEEDDFIRASYMGGVCYVNPIYQGQILHGTKCYDINSMYPYIMTSKLLPYGNPIEVDGYRATGELYPLAIYRIQGCFNLKDGHPPSLIIKGPMGKNEFLTEMDRELTLTVTNIDLQTILEDYDCFEIKYLKTYLFRGSTELFKKYILPIYEKKNTTKGAEKQVNKIKMNSLYGKFAMAPDHTGKVPYMDVDGVVRFKIGDTEEGKPIYTAVASFITAYARQYLYSMIRPNWKIYCYSDTDSLHILGDAVPGSIWLDDKALGACKVEHNFTSVKYLRKKCYCGYDLCEGEGKTMMVKCAGMPASVKEEVTFENFEIGSKFTGKLMPVKVKGGIILRDTVFQIRSIY